MPRIKFPALAGLSTVLGAVLFVAAPQNQAPADLVLTNGRILTVDARDSVAEAIAIADGKIVAVGTSAQIRPRIGSQTEVIDLRGRTATPGLIDSHVHFQGADSLFFINLSDLNIRSIDDVLARVREKVATLRPGEWVRGRGWDEGKLAERRSIVAADLDKVAPDNPVWLQQASGHFGVANSAAMRLVGITKDTRDPPAGTIDRDPQGNPTGIMRESAEDLITDAIPPLNREQERRGLLKIIEDFNREGMTGAKDPGISPGRWDLYRELLNEDKLNVRIFALWSGGATTDTANQALARIEALPKPPASFGEGRLFSGGVKLYLDGAVLAHTAWVYNEWFNNGPENPDKGNFGYPTIEPEVYKEMVRKFHGAGVHVSTHAIGDRAIDWAVDTYDEVLKARPVKNLRHGIIHASMPTDHAIGTMSRLQKDYQAGYPEASSTFMWWLGDNLIRHLGPDRASRFKPFASYLDRGIQWTGGSDYTVTPYPARYGIWASVARKTLGGNTPFGLEESVNVKAALRSYTIWAAHQLFLDDKVGSIEVGKDADIAVWDRDFYSVPTDQLKDVRCELTLLRGKVVFRAGN